jgi:hypothetical protein
MNVEQHAAAAAAQESQPRAAHRPRRRGRGRSAQALVFCGAALAAALFAAGRPAGADTDASASPVSADQAERPRSIIDLQPFRTADSISVDLPAGGKATVTLINLNPNVNRWFLLKVSPDGKGATQKYHLVNPFPGQQRLFLAPHPTAGLLLAADSKTLSCPLWNPMPGGALEAARAARQAFAPLCGERLFLRNPVTGHRTAIEAVTDFLRDRLPGGDAIVDFVRDTFFQDAYRESARTAPDAGGQPAAPPPQSPPPARIDPAEAGRIVVPADLGIPLEAPVNGMRLGQWYAAKDNPGIFVSLIEPGAVAPEILKSDTAVVRSLGSVEAKALAYLVAFDLNRFDLGFALGTEHPRVDWSERILPQMKIASLPGPDGIGTIAPLVATGMVSPVEAARTVATFTAGFKRIHGAFRYGQLAYRNHGSHYGFIESGVVLSTLQPELATLLVLNDGTVEMTTWTEQDDSYLARIAYARQNGVPIIETDPATHAPVPGRLVGRWLEGNWAGSKDLELRTLRAGAALQESGGRRFLIYGWFSTATPSAMARVFQAYGCRYAMLLDMNALEHTYCAIYRRDGARLLVEHLIQGMSVLDKSVKGTYIPRFIGYPDDRDFFYVMKRESPKEAP